VCQQHPLALLLLLLPLVQLLLLVVDAPVPLLQAMARPLVREAPLLLLVLLRLLGCC
jgi:hypothetical protein